MNWTQPSAARPRRHDRAERRHLERACRGPGQPKLRSRCPPAFALNSPPARIRELPLGPRCVWRMTARNSSTGGQLCRSTREKGP
jgi:hypothetical protein